MKLWHLAALTIPAMLVAGCIPIRSGATDWPAVDGKVIDGMTGKPIAGAAVKIRATASDLSEMTTTDANGRFSFSRREHEAWKAYDAPADNSPAPVISVTAPAHYPFEHRLDGSMSPETIPLAPSQ
jgi:hypothetical protein